MAFPSINEQMDVIREGAVDVLPEEELVAKIEQSIKENKPMNVKLGCDPSKPDLHIGHAVVLNKLRHFQDLGHNAILIIGDFTAMIGDPSGRNKTRPQLTLEETRINGQSYLEQATIVLSKERLFIRYNSEWLDKMTFRDVIHLSAQYTIAQMLVRDDFEKRFKNEVPISIHELLYPLAQAMDSVAIQSDVELGGTDQKFNLLVGREIQKAYNIVPQCIVTVPLLEGLDGKEKMSKSLNNYIALTDSPKEMFGKTMSIPDELISRYFLYAVYEKYEKVKELEEKMLQGKINPRDLKAELAKRIVARYYNDKEAQLALEEFDRIFKHKDLPNEIEEFLIDSENNTINIVDVLALVNLVQSKKEAKRLIQQGGIYVDNQRIDNINEIIDISDWRLIKLGKRRFFKLKKSV